MAGSIVVPVQVNVRVNQQQLNSVSSQITSIVNKSKGFFPKIFSHLSQIVLRCYLKAY